MKSCFAAPLLLIATALTSTSALAAKLPAIKASSKNAVPECATPGRMLGLLKVRNPALDARYDAIAVEYMRQGEELGIRWDFAFYQMILETGALTYRNGSKPGDVKPSQNNFAGLGATGKGEPGESFKDIASGVRAHLQHLLMYSGERVADPVADRTRKVQEWGVLTGWQAKFKTPITFTDLVQKWAPGSRDYSGNLDAIADQFDEDFCKKADPRPEQLAMARTKAPAREAVAEAKPRKERHAIEDRSERVSGAELARRNIAEERAEAAGTNVRNGLGGAAIARQDAVAQPTTIINAPTKSAAADSAPVQVAAAAGQAAKAIAPPPAPPSAAGAKCNVFTASYGGQRAVIIKAVADGGVNFTVLDVNEGAEKRETEAFIAAYARGGQQVGDAFATQAQALDKAFELCPEG